MLNFFTILIIIVFNYYIVFNEFVITYYNANNLVLNIQKKGLQYFLK